MTALVLSPTESFRSLARRVHAVLFNRYHPELHYMRGPGPACRRAAALRG